MALFNTKQHSEDDYDDEGILDTDREPEFSEYNDDYYGADDDVFDEDEHTGARKLTIPILIISAAIVASCIMVFFVFFNNPTGDGSDAPQPSNTQTTGVDSGEQTTDDENSPAGGEGVTVAETVGVKHSGSQNGSKANGTSVILGFNYAYYVERDGEKALSFFNPNNLEYDAKYIQEYIDQVPQGTKYNLEITPVVVGKDYDVRLYIQLPGTSPVVYDQRYTISKNGDKYFFEQFTSDEVKSE